MLTYLLRHLYVTYVYTLPPTFDTRCNPNMMDKSGAQIIRYNQGIQAYMETQFSFSSGDQTQNFKLELGDLRDNLMCHLAFQLNQLANSFIRTFRVYEKYTCRLLCCCSRAIPSSGSGILLFSYGVKIYKNITD